MSWYCSGCSQLLSSGAIDRDEYATRRNEYRAAVGTARVVHDPRETVDLGNDYILVCPSTDPGWTPLFLTAGGLVMEIGGMMSHGAVVAREYGIPAVVGVKDATRLFHDGELVEVNGATGEIRRVTLKV